jgi:hypothetical protein
MALKDKRFAWAVKDAEGVIVDRVQWEKDGFAVMPTGGSVVWEPAPEREAFADHLAHGGSSD